MSRMFEGIHEYKPIKYNFENNKPLDLELKLVDIKDIINNVFGLKYFWIIQIDISSKNEKRFQIHKKIQTKATDFN